MDKSPMGKFEPCRDEMSAPWNPPPPHVHAVRPLDARTMTTRDAVDVLGILSVFIRGSDDREAELTSVRADNAKLRETIQDLENSLPVVALDGTAKKIQKEQTRWVDEQRSRMLGNIAACGSPIEELFMWTWANNMPDAPTSRESDVVADAFVAAGITLGDASVYLGVDIAHCCHVYVFQQVSVGDYRADFGFFCSDAPITARGAKVILRGVVEMDGHDFHERTKEQASKDKKRDRKMALAGWEVLRFTGSDVYNDSEACLEEVLALINAKTAKKAENG